MPSSIEASRAAAPWGALLFPVLATVVTAVLGGLGSARSAELYQQLDKPSWAPPGAVFGPVWTVLYVLMAIAGWLVVRTLGWPAARQAITLFTAQLVLNALWTWLFFRWRMGALAFLEILLLLGVLVLTVAAFWRARPLAGALMLPYLAWVGFAAALTWAAWRRNPGLV